MKSNKLTPKEAMRNTAEEVISIINNESCIARTIVSDPIDDHHWLFFLRQFKDPALIPEPRPLEPGAEPGTVWNFYKKQWVEQPQGLYAERPPGAIQLMSGTLLPKKGYIELYNNANVSQGHQHVVALFNSGDNPDRYLGAPDEEKIDTSLEPCVIKACFENDAGTNAQWWIKGQSLFDLHNGKYPIATRFNQLQISTRKFEGMNKGAHNKNERNEVIFYPRLQGFVGLAPVTQIMYDIVNALYTQLLVRAELGIHVPVLKINGDKEEFDLDAKVFALLFEAECGNEFIFKMHGLIHRMGGEATEEWQSFLAKLKSQLSGIMMRGNSDIELIYKSILQTYFFYPKQTLSWPFLLKAKSNILHALFVGYADGRNLGARSVEMLEALNGGGWKQWDEFKNLLVLYSHYLKGLHRFPNKENAEDFYERVYEELPKTFQSEKERIAFQSSNKEVRAAIKARKLWSDIVSYTDQYLTTPQHHLTVAAVKKRMQTLEVPGNYDAHIKKIVTYLQERSVILLAFDAKKVFQKDFISLEALTHVEPSVRPQREEGYDENRDKLEDKIFSYLSSGLQADLYHCSQARPRYAFLCIANDKAPFKLPNESYGKSYVVLNHKVKFNSLFVPHNIIQHHSDSSSKYKIPTPATYFTLEVLLERVTDEELLGLLHAATGLMPKWRFGVHISDLQAYIPPVNLFDAAVVDKIFIHPREYVLTPTESSWVAERGIDLVNTDNYIGERDSKVWAHIFKTDNVAELKRLCEQDPARLKKVLSSSLIDVIENESKAVYSYIAAQTTVKIDLALITAHAQSTTMLLFLYQKLVEQTKDALRLDEVSSKNIFNVWKKGTAKLSSVLSPVLDLIYQLPDNTWQEREEKTGALVDCHFKDKLIAFCIEYAEESLLVKLWETAYIRERDLAPHYENFYESYYFRSIKDDLILQRVNLDTPQIQKLILHYINTSQWVNLTRLNQSMSHLKMPLRLGPDRTILNALEKCHWLKEVMPLCVATPGFFAACNNSVSAVMRNAARDNYTLLTYLKRYFSDEFFSHAAAQFVLLDDNGAKEPSRNLLYQSGNFMGLENYWKVSAIKKISRMPHLSKAFDAFDAILSKEDIDSITYNLQRYQDDEVRRQACESLLRRIDEQGHLKPVDDPITNLSVLEEKSPAPEHLADALQVLTWKIINKQASFSDYEAKLNAIVINYSYLQQIRLGVSLTIQDNNTLLQSDIASFIGRFTFCARQVFYKNQVQTMVHPNLILAFLDNCNDGSDVGFLLLHLLQPELEKFEEVKAFLTKHPQFITTSPLMDALFRYENPDIELLTMVCERSLGTKDIVRLARRDDYDYEKWLTICLRSIGHEEQALLTTLEILLQYHTVNMTLLQTLVFKLESDTEKATPSKIRCWLYALEHPESASLQAYMENVLSIAALKRSATPSLFTHLLNTLLTKRFIVEYEQSILFLLKIGADFACEAFTRLVSCSVASLRQGALLTIREQENTPACLRSLSDYLEYLMRTQQEELLFEIITWLLANFGIKTKAILSELHAKALSSNQTKVLNFYFDQELVSSSAALTEYLETKITLADAKIEPVALRLARVVDWDMRSLFAECSKQGAAITPKTGSEDCIQKAADFIREYELTPTQQTKIQQFVADKIHHFLDYDPTKEAMVSAALKQQDYFTALEAMPVLQSLLTITDVHDHFSELRQFKNQSLQINIEKPNVSEIETHLLIMEKAYDETQPNSDNTSAIVNKIPGLVQCIVALAKIDKPGEFSHLSLRFKCNALLIQARDLLKENKASLHTADNEEKSTIDAEKITAIITSYHKNKYHWFGRKQWVCDQDKASAELLEKLEDQTVDIKEKEALLFNVVKRSTQVDVTLFKVINRNLPVHASAPRRTRGVA